MNPTLGVFRAFRVHTECADEEQLADKLAPYCGDDSLALPGAIGLAVGAVTRFRVMLGTGALALSGRVQVVSTRGGGPDVAPSSVRLKVLELDDGCLAFWSALSQRRRQSSRIPPPPPGGRPPPPLPVVDPPPHAFTALLRESFFGEEPGSDDPTVIARAADAPPPLAAPARLATPTRLSGKSPTYTGKTQAYMGKPMVARKSPWPPWAQALGRGLAHKAHGLWEKIPGETRPALGRYGPWTAFWVVGVLCGLWWAPVPRETTAPAVAFAGVPTSTVPTVVALPNAPLQRVHEHCSAQITSEPSGTMVHWGDSPLGDTPLLGIEVPCGRTLVSFRHQGYDPLVVTMTATLDGPVVYAGTLKRPESTLRLSTEPQGAAVFLNNAQIGVTPLSMEVPLKQAFKLRLEKQGFASTERDLQVDGPEKTVTLRLDRAKAKGRRRR